MEEWLDGLVNGWEDEDEWLDEEEWVEEWVDDPAGGREDEDEWVDEEEWVEEWLVDGVTDAGWDEEEGDKAGRLDECGVEVEEEEWYVRTDVTLSGIEEVEIWSSSCRAATRSVFFFSHLISFVLFCFGEKSKIRVVKKKKQESQERKERDFVNVRLGYFSSSSTARTFTTLATAPDQSKASVDRIKSRSKDENAIPAMTLTFFCLSLLKKKKR